MERIKTAIYPFMVHLSRDNLQQKTVILNNMALKVTLS